MGETFAHTQRLPEHGSALSQLRETRALAKREKKTTDLGRIFLPASRQGSESELSSTAKSRGSLTNQVRDLKD